MTQKSISDVQSGYDRIAEEYARRIYGELQHKPLDRSCSTALRILSLIEELRVIWDVVRGRSRDTCRAVGLRSAA